MKWKKILNIGNKHKINIHNSSKIPEDILDYPGKNDRAFDLYKEGKFKEAYLLLLEAAFISGSGHYSNDEFQDFGRLIPPGNYNMIKICVEELCLTEFQVHSDFVKFNTITHHQFNTPLHPQDIWHDQLRMKLFKA